MYRIVPTAVFAALVGAALPAQAQTLDGHWMAVGDMLGLAPGNIEALTIEDGHAASVLWRAPTEACATAPAAEGCAMPVPSASGAISVDAVTFGITADEADASPFPDVATWPFLALPGGAWSIISQDRRLMSMREASVNGNSVPLMRIWLQVAPEVPEQLYDYLTVGGRDIARSICGVTTLHADAALWQGFTAHLASLSAPMHDMRLGTPQADPSRYGPQAAQSLHQTAAWIQGDLPEGSVMVADILYPVPAATAAAIADCTTRLFGG
ncbi:hypothetical protein [Pararhodobacter zhoushanensis]|uniref:hypothetical protein n=1 Tax=Pararhodobacter zhoushanensis TaxID=2479545 RepID=UPI000F8C5D57|nr:hypothetical protein [Pararhodobacter zhoushanensis]